MSDQEVVNGPVVRIHATWGPSWATGQDAQGIVVAVILPGDKPDPALMDKLYGPKDPATGRRRRGGAPTLPSIHPRILVVSKLGWRPRVYYVNDSNQITVLKESTP